MCVGCWAGVTYLGYTVLTNSNKSETAVHCCDPALSVLVMLVSRNVFQVVSALQSIVLIALSYKVPMFGSLLANGLSSHGFGAERVSEPHI